MWRIFHRSPSIAEWRTAYLNYAQATNVRRTVESKRFFFRLLTETFASRTPVTALRRDRVLSFLARVAGERTGGSANDTRKRLSAAWTWAAQNMKNFPKENPFFGVGKFPMDEQPRYVPPYEDFAAVLDCADEADYALLLTALHTAARRGELFRLRWDDVDFNRKIVRLGTRKRAGGGMEYDWIPMTTTLTSVLAAHKEKTKSELIFSRDGGIPYKTRPRLLHRLCGKAGVRRFGYHAIRHLSASLMAQYGMAIPGIQSVLRHKTPLTTSVYLHRLGVVQQDLDRVFSLCGGRHDHENKHAGVQAPSRHTR